MMLGVNNKNLSKILEKFNERCYGRCFDDYRNIESINNNILQDGFGCYDVILVTFRGQCNETYDLFIGYSESEDMLLIETLDRESILTFWQENDWTIEELQEIKRRGIL